MTFKKASILLKALVPALIIGLALCGCATSEEEKDSRPKDQVTVGFSQIGAESDWRIASTESMQSTLTASAGYNLLFKDGQQKQENQLLAMREFIDQAVDYIILDPITETGWDATLREAYDAGIPVIIMDRRVDTFDDSVYTVWAGSDFLLEGKRACKWLRTYLKSISFSGDVNIIHIKGTTNSSAQLGRTKALKSAAKKYGWNILMSEDGDFVQAKGREIMENALATYGDDINVVYCENDSEAIGAIEAIEQSGRRVGSDISGGEIMILSFDATRQGLLLTLNGKISVNTECNPEYGPVCDEIIGKLKDGLEVPHEMFMEESQFSAITDIKEIKVGDKIYPVTMVDRELIDARSY